MKNTHGNYRKLLAIVVALTVIASMAFISYLFVNLAHSLRSAKQSSPTSSISMAGTLRLLRVDWSDGYSVQVYELRQGQNEPQEVPDPGFDLSKITGRIEARSTDGRYLVFAPHFILDTATDSIIPLPAPGIAEQNPDYFVPGVSFSPDGLRLAYVASSRTLSGTTIGRIASYVYGLVSGDTNLILEGPCHPYQVGGERCKHVGAPQWLDSDNFIFTQHVGEFTTIFEEGSENDPGTSNHLTVTSVDGDVKLSTEDHNNSYTVIDGIVFRHDYKTVYAWLEGSELVRGVYDSHLLLPPTLSRSIYDLGPVLNTISPDGRFILVVNKSQWRLHEVRTGQETVLGTDLEVGPNTTIESCLWSLDISQVACFVRDEAGDRNLLVIPLSEDRHSIVLTDPRDDVEWYLFDWLP